MKKYNKKYNSIIFILCVTLFTGCSSKDGVGLFNDDFKEFTKEKFSNTQAPDYVKNSIEEKINERKYINLDNMKKLSSVLEELGSIDGKVYLLSKDSEDIFLTMIKNSHRLNINSFDKLNRHLKDTTNYFIFIKNNRFLNDRVNIVTLQNQEVFKKTLDKIPFAIDGKVAISDVLEHLKEASGFSIVAKGLSSASEKKTEKLANEKLFSSNSIDELFENTYISFSGSNVMELLDYLSNSFNVYVDVDYETKTIVFSRLKSKLFSVSLSNVQYSGTLDVKKNIKTEVGEGNTDEEKAIETKIEFDILKSLETDISTLIKQSTKGATFAFNRTVGTVFAMADKKTMENISLVINNFNEVFEKQVDFQLEIYEFAVTKEYDIGINIGGKIGDFEFGIDKVALADRIFGITKTKSNGDEFGASGELDNNFVRLLKQTRHGYLLKNSIPYSIDITDSKSYVKSVTTESIISNGVTSTTVTPTTSEIGEGTILSVLSKVNGNKVELNIQPKIVKINDVAEAVFGGNTITLPDVSVNTFSSNVMLENGEKIIIGHLTSYEDANDYKGVVPIENFVLGGATNKKYFRKETVFVVSANIRK